MAKRPATANVQLKLRLRESLRRDLERAARRRDVSLNQQMVDDLEWSRLTKLTLKVLDIDFIQLFGSEAGLEEMVARAAFRRAFSYAPGGAPTPTPAERLMLRSQIAYCFWLLGSEAPSELEHIADVIREVDQLVDAKAASLEKSVRSGRPNGDEK